MSAICMDVRESLASLANLWDQVPAVSSWVCQDGPEEAVRRASASYGPRPGGEVLEEAARVGARLVLAGDEDWPERLLGCEDAPVGLWVRGDVSLLGGAVVGLVGSRAASEYGTHVASDLGAGLAAASVNVITSGGFGVEGAATRGACSAALDLGAPGRPVVVCACGVDRAHPVAHSMLLQTVAERGCLVSPFRPGVQPTRQRFMARDRLLALLSDAVVVVEASAMAGALHPARVALRREVPVGVVPGPVTSAASAGCHALLREHPQARLVTGTSDVLDLLS